MNVRSTHKYWIASIKTIVVRYSVNQPAEIDPYNLPKEFFDTTSAIAIVPYYLVVDEDLSDLNVVIGEDAVKALKKYNGSKKIHFVQSNVGDLKDCEFNDTLFCYKKYNRNSASIRLSNEIQCIFKGKPVSLHKRLFRFSKFLKSSDGNYLVTKLLTRDTSERHEEIWRVVYHKKSEKWVIENLEIESYGH